MSIELLEVARPIRLAEVMTYNKLERMRPGHRWSLNQKFKGMSANAWKDVDPISLSDGERVVYSLNAVVHASSRPDPDSINWLSKRLLDGAVVAGVIPDDSKTYLAGTMTGAAKHIRSLPSGIVLFQAFYWMSDELLELLFSA